MGAVSEVVVLIQRGAVAEAGYLGLRGRPEALVRSGG